MAAAGERCRRIAGAAAGERWRRRREWTNDTTGPMAWRAFFKSCHNVEHDDGLFAERRRRAKVRQRLATRAERMQRQECALHPNVTGSLSRSTSEEGSRNLELLRVAVEGQKENDGEKGDGSTTTRHDDERRSVLVRNRRLPKRWTRFFRHPV
jgi:hypothetical protein